MIESKNEVGWTLRFPRVIKIRNDKSYKDCMTVQEVREIGEVNKKMIRKRT